MLKIVHLKFIWIILNDVLTIRRHQATGAVLFYSRHRQLGKSSQRVV